ncbi:hypothetical protein ACFVZD_37085 [Streptomyces sp. NPDC058287]
MTAAKPFSPETNGGLQLGFDVLDEDQEQPVAAVEEAPLTRHEPGAAR